VVIRSRRLAEIQKAILIIYKIIYYYPLMAACCHDEC
jgi:hypothetical protein